MADALREDNDRKLGKRCRRPSVSIVGMDEGGVEPEEALDLARPSSGALGGSVGGAEGGAGGGCSVSEDDAAVVSGAARAGACVGMGGIGSSVAIDDTLPPVVRLLRTPTFVKGFLNVRFRFVRPPMLAPTGKTIFGSGSASLSLGSAPDVSPPSSLVDGWDSLSGASSGSIPALSCSSNMAA